MRTPNFFIVGAPKCGTTSLSEYLREHPQIFVSEPKEPFFFCTDMPGLCKVESEAAYLDLFQSACSQHLAVGEASAVYMYSSVAGERLHEFDKDARIIAMLRNPLQLMPSYHSQQLFALNEDEPDFVRAWQLQEERAAGNSIPRLCRDGKVLQYRSLGLLGEQVERLVATFAPEQILFVLFDDFSASTASVYDTVLRFLDVPHDGRQSFPRFNPNKQHRFPAIESLRRTVARHPMLNQTIRRGVQRLGITPWLTSLTRKPSPRQSLDAEMRETLHDAFAADIELLSTLLKRDLSHWTAPAKAAA